MQTDFSQIRFGLYVRKSSEQDDRQALSIESQIMEMKSYAKKNNFKVAETFIDSASAHKPNNRPEFNRMLELINDGKIDGIITWKADRLSRNSIEGGTLLYLLEKEVIKAIHTPYNRYLPTDNCLPLTIEFGMANQYSRNLSRDIKRGNKSKIEKGGICNIAPHGYLNDRLNKTVIPDPERFDLVRKMWDLMLTGSYSLKQICDMANDDWGFRTVKHKQIGGKPLAISSLHAIFSNKFYFGWIKKGENENWGTHKRMVTQTEFEHVQSILRRQGRLGETSQEFPFTGYIKCGECGSGVTAEEKVKYACPNCRKQHSAKHPRKCSKCGHQITKETIAKGNWYIYYRCTKKKAINHKCSQKCTKGEDLENQFLDIISDLEIDPDFEAWALEWLNFMNEDEFNKKENENDRFMKGLKDAEQLLKSLIKMRSREEISQSQFLEEKTEVEEEIRQWKKRFEEAERNRDEWIEKAEEELNFILGIVKNFNNGTVREKKETFAKTGSNFLLKDKELTLDVKKAYVFFRKMKKMSEPWIEPKKQHFSLKNKATMKIFLDNHPIWCSQ